MNKHRKDWSRLLPLISIKFDSGSAVAAQSGLIWRGREVLRLRAGN